MIVYGSLKVKTITYATVLVTCGTIILCYTLAVILGHVPAWLPMISDCAVEAPEKYLFRLGVIPGAVALFANVIMVYYAFPDFRLRSLELATGVVASVGLAVLTAVNEDENNTIHVAGAISCFVGYYAYMAIVAYNAPRDPKISPASAISKRIFVVLGIVLLIAAGLFSLDWSKYKVYVAVCEWLGVLDIEVFNMTFVHDFEDLTLLEVKPDGLLPASTTISESKGNAKPVAVEKIPI